MIRKFRLINGEGMSWDLNARTSFFHNSSYDLELAIFTVSSAGLDGLTKVFPTLKAGSGGGETLTRATSYSVGDAVTAVGDFCMHTGRRHCGIGAFRVFEAHQSG